MAGLSTAEALVDIFFLFTCCVPEYPNVHLSLNVFFFWSCCVQGTGKTIVGAYIVHHFIVHNSQNQRRVVDPNDKDKKSVVLYCGPSNKSVDVVAGK